MLNNDLDIARWRTKLGLHSRVQIADILQPSAAEAFARELAEAIPWQLAERSGGTSCTTPRGAYPDALEYAQLLQRSYAAAADSYQFAYDSYMLVKAAREGWDPGLLVHGLLRFFNTSEFIAFARFIANEADITHVTAQCTRYRPGHYLLPHDDQDVDEGRRYAFVFNLSHDWRPDWGGQLQFIDEEDRIVETFLPRWNSLSLFRVPQRHQVTLVAPWATRPRYAITGWWLAK
jgi:SM-20-related protein